MIGFSRMVVVLQPCLQLHYTCHREEKGKEGTQLADDSTSENNRFGLIAIENSACNAIYSVILNHHLQKSLDITQYRLCDIYIYDKEGNF